MAFQAELEDGIAAVKAAARVCRTVQQDLVTAETLEKKDKSPVTVADFAAQAIVCAFLAKALPADPLVGEEDAADLRDDAQTPLREAVVKQVAAGMEEAVDTEQVLAWIDRGNSEGREKRYWTLDPIDGTKGFLRGEQYAIALALIEDGEVVLGLLGCPNLEHGNQKGTLFVATRDGPATVQPLFEEGAAQIISVSALTAVAEARFCESVESAHSNQGESAEIARLLGIEQEPYRIDSQCKYAAVARGDASIYLRLPTRADYQEKIWDHAAGKIIVERAGGTVTDIHGKPLDFSRGKYLEQNQGIVATCGAVHAEVLEAVRQVRT